MEILTSFGRTTMGEFRDLPFRTLPVKVLKELNVIGHTGKNSSGEPTSREDYLNSLGLGTFRIIKLRNLSGYYDEEFLIIWVTKDPNAQDIAQLETENRTLRQRIVKYRHDGVVPLANAVNNHVDPQAALEAWRIEDKVLCTFLSM